MQEPKQLQQLQEMVDRSRRIVFFGGAGVSTESGIPDFRSVDGLYNQRYKYPPEVMLSHSFYVAHTEEFFDFYRTKMLYLDAQPNAAHKKLAELEEEAKAKAPKEEKKEEVPGLAQIGIEDFAKVELRAAKITACEPIPKAKKLLKLTLDDGTGTPRTVASGIAPWYQPEDLTGKTIVVVANLKPAKLCGVESNGMILAADCPGGQVKVLFLDDSIPAGSKIR